MKSTLVQTENATLKVAENEVTAVLIHLKKLLRIKNQLCSPLLRLPTETIVRILSYIVEAVERPRIWQPILSTYHQIHTTMCTAEELWWKVNCMRAKVAMFTFMRSEGNPQVITACFDP